MSRIVSKMLEPLDFTQVMLIEKKSSTFNFFVALSDTD